MSEMLIGRSSVSGVTEHLHARHCTDYPDPALPLPAGEPSFHAESTIVVGHTVQDSCAHPERRATVTVYNDPSASGAVSMTDFDVTTGAISFRTSGGASGHFKLAYGQ